MRLAAWWLLTTALAQDAPADGLVERVVPSAVHLRVKQEPTAPELDLLYRWLGVSGPGLGGVRTTTGTGFLAGTPTVLLTNHHVVAGARSISVETSDGRTLVVDPRAVRPDTRADLAVLQVEGLPAGLPLGGSAAIGAPVVLVGFARDQDVRATAGLVTVTDARDLPDAPVREVTLTDAAVIRGMSGGPAIDRRGRVVGVIVAGSEERSSLGGQGVLVPGDAVVRAVEALGEPCARGFLGVEVSPVDGGLRVRRVSPGSAAEEAGVVPGDVIEEVDGDPARDPWDLVQPCRHPTELVLRDRGSLQVVPRPVPSGHAISTRADGRVQSVSNAAWRLGLEPGDVIDDDARSEGPTVERVDGKGFVVVP